MTDPDYGRRRPKMTAAPTKLPPDPFTTGRDRLHLDEACAALVWALVVLVVACDPALVIALWRAVL